MCAAKIVTFNLKKKYCDLISVMRVRLRKMKNQFEGYSLGYKIIWLGFKKQRGGIAFCYRELVI